MKEFIEQVLHQKIELQIYNPPDSFPLILKGMFIFYQMTISGNTCLIAEEKEALSFSEIKKQKGIIEQLTDQYCVFYFKNRNYYAREKMLEEGISFIWENGDIYLPFLGMFLQKNSSLRTIHNGEISFLTQKLLLTALYEDWNQVTLTDAANKLGVSKMSITRVFDEIEEHNLPVIRKKGRCRMYFSPGDKKETWALMEPLMRNPLLKEYFLEKDLPDPLIKSGISGLSEFSMLGDNSYPTYAVTKYEMKEKGIEQKRQIPKGERPGCIVQKLGYCIPFREGTVIDPLTISLLLKEEEDPRIEMAVEEMLEEYVW